MIREDVIRSAHPDGVEMRSSRGNGQEGLTPPGEDREAAPKSLHPKLLSAAPRSKSSSSSYSLIGKDVDHEFSDDEQYKALCKQLDSENRSKRALEAQVQAMQAQLRELDVSISRLHHQMTETDGKLATQTKELNQLRAVGVDTYTLQECEEIERRLKSTLDLITARKVFDRLISFTV